MKKIRGLASLLGAFSLFTTQLKAEDNSHVWYEDQPWSIQSSSYGLNPFYELDEIVREEYAEDILKDYCKDEGKKLGKEMIENWEITRKIERFCLRARDKYLTLRIGKVPRNESTGLIDPKVAEKHEHKKKFFIMRPEGTKVEFYGQNPEHVGISGSIKTNSAELILEPRFRIPIGEKGIKLPKIEIEYDYDEGFSIEAKYSFRF